jgi:hypothetical protein
MVLELLFLVSSLLICLAGRKCISEGFGDDDDDTCDDNMKRTGNNTLISNFVQLSSLSIHFKQKRRAKWLA